LLATDARRGRVGGPTERFDRYARVWIESYAGRTSRGLRTTTRASYARQLERYAIPYFGARRLDELTPADVRSFAQHVGRESSGRRDGLPPVTGCGSRSRR
jgi:hypothetical protein